MGKQILRQGFESQSFIGELKKIPVVKSGSKTEKGRQPIKCALSGWLPQCGFIMLGNFGINCRIHASELSHPRREGAGIFVYQLLSIID